jgi:uncharacterized membrane protein
MFAALRTWSILVLSLGYLVVAHIALINRSAALAAFAVTLLVLLVVTSIKGRLRMTWRLLVAAAGAWVVVLVVQGAPPVPLMLPPVLIPVAIAWLFGRTLFPGEMPLIERIARVFHAPLVPSPEILAYARRVTGAWVILLVSLAFMNAVLFCNLEPGGLIAIAGFEPPWPVSPAAFAWLSSTGTYLLIGGMFVAEFTVRILRFPDYRFRNPVQFLNAARSRMPDIVAAFRHG